MRACSSCVQGKSRVKCGVLRFYENKWRGVTISLRTGGQGHPTPIHTPTHLQHSNIHKKYWKDGRTDKASYRVARLQLKSKQGQTDGPTDGPTNIMGYKNVECTNHPSSFFDASRQRVYPSLCLSVSWAIRHYLFVTNQTSHSITITNHPSSFLVASSKLYKRVFLYVCLSDGWSITSLSQITIHSETITNYPS